MFLWVFNIFSPVSSGTAFWYNAFMKKAAQQKEDFYGPHDHQGHCPAAGVSVTTVSRALNNAPEINSQTRERVLQVCREQGYRSNLLARSLVSSRTRVLGVILPVSPAHFHASLVLHPGALRPGTGLPDHVVLRPG